ncbi:MAG TPA: POTRA domain-containing protein [Bryobacteraceae bacterium]|nr:POTRA domain-containing protein [Bryobacteraceae bacterium]
MRSPVFLLLLFAAVIARAQEQRPSSSPNSMPQDFEGRTIAQVEFDPPDQPIPIDQLQRLLPFHAGSTLHLAELHAAIEKLYQTGRFSDISIGGEPAPNDGGSVIVRIATHLNYFVSSVKINGAAEPPTKSQLLASTKLELGALFEDGDLEQAVENMQDRFRANGLYNSTITYRVERDPSTEEIRINFDVHSGARARFDGVTLAGNFNQSPGAVIRDTHWRRGIGRLEFPGWRQMTESLVQAGVNRVLSDFQRGDHLQASVSLGELDYHHATNTVTPSLEIESGPIIEVRTTGVKLSRGKLRQLVPVFQERTVDRSLLVEGRRNLVEYFQSQGYFDPQVDFTETTPAPGQEVVDYSISLNVRHRLEYIEIEGNHYFDTATVRERLEITPARYPRSRYGRFSQTLLDRDLDAIRELYHSNGFREADVKAIIDDNYKNVQDHLGVRISVNEGAQWFVNALDIQGAPESDLPYLRSVLQSTAGEPFSEANVAADRESILSYYYNNGYPNAAFDWNESPAASEHRVNLQYVITTGKRQYVRSVLVRGLETTRASLVDSRIFLKGGDPISQRLIADSQQKLYDLGIFSRVQTAIQNPVGDEDSRYVLFDLDEADKWSFTGGVGAQLGRIGAGVTTFDEPAGTTGFVPRISLGISRLNVLGLGRTISLQTRFSTIEQRVLLSYIAAQFLDNEALTLTLSGLFDNSRDIRTFAARRYEGTAQLAERLSRANSVQYRLTFRRVTLSDIVITPELIPLFSQPDRVGMVSMTFIQDRRDDPVNSHRGIYNTIDAGVSLKQLGSETEFTRLLMRNSTYHPIGRDVVIARTLQFGWIQRLGGLSEIPLAERFFAGGASSNRAFPDNQAGPRDLETGFPIGGDALLMHSTELRFPLFGDNVGGVLFHDIGNVFSDVRDIGFHFDQRNIQDFDYMVQSFGFGIRYSTPIGPIRVDFSLSPNSPRFYGFQGTFDQLLAGTGTLTNQRINVFQFHFSLGQTF